MEDPIQILTDSFVLNKDSEVNPSDLLEESLSIDRIHLSINLSLKLLCCTCILNSGHLHNMPKKKNKCAPVITTALGEVIKIGKGLVGWTTYLHNLCMGRSKRVALLALWYDPKMMINSIDHILIKACSR